MVQSRVSRCAAGAALGAVLWGGPSRAETAHAEVNLEYVALAEAAGCPDRAAFTSAIATRLGYDPVAADGARTARKTLRVRFERHDGAAIQVVLRLSKDTGEVEAEKTLVSETGGCAEVGNAAAFAAATLLDPRAMFPRPTKPAAPGPSLDSRSPGTWPWYEPPPTLPPPSAPPAAPVAPWRWHAGVVGVGCAGCAPSWSAGGAIFVGVSKGRAALDAGVRADLPASTSESGRSVSSSLVQGELFPHARLGPLRLGPVGAMGALFGESAGERHVSLWAAAGLRAGAEWTISPPVFVRLALDGAVVLNRVSLRVGGAEVWSTPPLVAAANVGVGAEF